MPCLLASFIRIVPVHWHCKRLLQIACASSEVSEAAPSWHCLVAFCTLADMSTRIDDTLPSGLEQSYEEPGFSGRTDFGKLRQATMNEKLAPEILQYQEDLVQRVREALEAQEELLQRLESEEDTDMLLQVLTLELDRMRYLLKEYLRTRIHKIQRFAALCLLEPEVQQRLSAKELEFADEFFRAQGRHMKATVLDHLPRNYDQLTKRFAGDPDASIVQRPDPNVFVFARALEDCGQVPDGDDGQTALISQGDQLTIRYSSIAALVASGQMELF